MNTADGAFDFGMIMTLITAEPGTTICQYGQLLNESEIREGVNQSFYTCATLIDGKDPSSVSLNSG